MMQDRFTRPASRISLLYFAFASLWILFSDQVVTALFAGSGSVHLAQTIKGWGFVLITSLLFYALMRRTLHRLKTVACIDSLCGLPNRLAFIDELHTRCRAGVSRQCAFSVTILDIDNFSDLNDERGHGEGDALLALLGEALKNYLDKGWYIARLGGDEFGLLSPVNLDRGQALTVLSKLQHEVTRQSDASLLKEQRLSAGTAHFPEHGQNAHDLLRHADMALTYVKNHGRDRHGVYHEQLKLDLMERLSLIKDLNRACENKSLSVVYQPQWSVEGRCWCGAEVLVRWQHPVRGNIPPDVFIPLAEREGLIGSITLFVVEQAFRELKESGIGRECLPCLSINLSHLDLLNDSIMERLFSLIRREGERLPRIIMELTETAAMEDLDATLEAMHRWRRDNIEFSIDDFGTGYSSLARLKQLPIIELKVDRSFIVDIPRDQNDTVITKAILGMAQTLSLNVVAEGVETAQQVEFLRRHGCTTLQGFHLAKPMPVERLCQLVASHSEQVKDEQGLARPL